MVKFGSTEENLQENVNIIIGHLKGINLKLRRKNKNNDNKQRKFNTSYKNWRTRHRTMSMFKYLSGIINIEGTSEAEINERVTKNEKLFNTIKHRSEAK